MEPSVEADTGAELEHGYCARLPGGSADAGGAVQLCRCADRGIVYRCRCADSAGTVSNLPPPALHLHIAASAVAGGSGRRLSGSYRHCYRPLPRNQPHRTPDQTDYGAAQPNRYSFSVRAALRRTLALGTGTELQALRLLEGIDCCRAVWLSTPVFNSWTPAVPRAGTPRLGELLEDPQSFSKH